MHCHAFRTSELQFRQRTSRSDPLRLRGMATIHSLGGRSFSSDIPHACKFGGFQPLRCRREGRLYAKAVRHRHSEPVARHPEERRRRRITVFVLKIKMRGFFAPLRMTDEGAWPPILLDNQWPSIVVFLPCLPASFWGTNGINGTEKRCYFKKRTG